jgi:Ni/Co efflux regulator RcnB
MRRASIAFISVLCATLAGPSFADNDKGKGNSNKSDRSNNDRGRDNDDRRGNKGESRAANPGGPYQRIEIVDRDRDLVRTYYRTEYTAGRCPPGLAKKNNGCLPPGQAKRNWSIGQALPNDVVFHQMPRELWKQLTPPPQGYEYVRVNDDIVLMSTSTRVIAGLLGNLGSFD